MPTSIVIVPYDPTWPEIYAREAAGIRRALAGRLLAIEHIGSTAIPGLGAKPIVDVMAGVRSLGEAERCLEPLRHIGYAFDAEPLTRLPDDRLFVKWEQERRTVHLHVTSYGGEFWSEKLLFRDALRADPELALRYEALKRTLAPRFSDGPSYSAAKTAFIEAVLAATRRATGLTRAPYNCDAASAW
jgi:GrpB-like predicted nucleotidyltransferase (UPF0157 family)